MPPDTAPDGPAATLSPRAAPVWRESTTTGGGPVAQGLFKRHGTRFSGIGRWGVRRSWIGAMAVGTLAAGSLVVPVAAPAGASVAVAAFRGHGSIEEAYVLGATPGTRLTLVNGAGHRVG